MLSLPIKYAIMVLAELEEAKAGGRRMTVSELREALCAQQYPLADVMKDLRREGFIDMVGNRHFVACNLEWVTLYELCMAVDRQFAANHENIADGWPPMQRRKHLAAHEFDRQITGGIVAACKKVTLGDLFPCYPAAKTRPLTRAGQITLSPAEKLTI